MGGTILALLFVVNRAGLMSWLFFVPAAILIGREVIVGLFKGFELSRYYFPDTLLSNLKAGLSMLATCLLLASPWLQVWLDRMFAGTDKVSETFATSSPMVWMIGSTFALVGAECSDDRTYIDGAYFNGCHSGFRPSKGKLACKCSDHRWALYRGDSDRLVGWVFGQEVESRVRFWTYD